MDVSASTHTVVGVIKEGDPMGNKDRWFVDTGGRAVTLLLLWHRIIEFGFVRLFSVGVCSHMIAECYIILQL